MESWLGRPIARRQPHGPIRNRSAIAKPIVRKREDHRSRQAAAEGALDLPRQHFRLRRFALAEGVQAEFPEQQRSVAGDHL